MKQKQRIALFGMVAVALILVACDGDSGNNGVETEVDSSSSGDIFWSSSVAVSSSSEKIVWNYLNPDINYGEMTDTRDNQTYKTAVIGMQTWMAENLNYAVNGSWCYDNAVSNCNLYGRLYTWIAVMGVASTYNSAILGDSVNHQGICPDGWHVPRSSEWTTLENYVAGTALKSTSGWLNGGNGTDAYGFSALPGGNYGGSDFYYVGNYGYWWTAAEYSSTYAYGRYMDYDNADVGTGYYGKTCGRSLRCLKD